MLGDLALVFLGALFVPEYLASLRRQALARLHHKDSAPELWVIGHNSWCKQPSDHLHAVMLNVKAFIGGHLWHCSVQISPPHISLHSASTTAWAPSHTHQCFEHVFTIQICLSCFLPRPGPRHPPTALADCLLPYWKGPKRLKATSALRDG